MNMSPRHMLSMLFVALGCLTAGCADKAYLEIEFTGSGLPAIHHFYLEMTVTDGNGKITRGTGYLPESPTDQPIALPTTAALEFDNGETGTFTLNVSALGKPDGIVATARQTTMLKTKETWRIVVALQPVTQAAAAPPASTP